MDNTTRLKVLMKSISNDQPFQTSYHSINENHSIHLADLCMNSHMNDTHVLYLCLSNSMGDGPLSFAHYFHIQLPLPTNISITSFDVTVVSSREISIHWNIHPILNSISYRIQWFITNDTNNIHSLLVASNQSSVLLDNLIPFTLYKIRIHAFNINGDGPVHEGDLVRTHEDGMSNKA